MQEIRGVCALDWTESLTKARTISGQSCAANSVSLQPFFFLLAQGDAICKAFIGQMERKREEERPGEREEVRGCPCWQAGVTELPPEECECSGREEPGEVRAGAGSCPRDLGGDVRKRASAF